MEVYITKREFDHVLKELIRVQNFLTETFGSKFVDFRVKDGNMDVSSQLVTDAGKHLNSGDSVVVVTANKGHESIIDPLLETNVDDGNGGVPIVTSTKSLQVPPLLPSFHTRSEPVTVPILHSNKVSISLVPPVVAPQKLSDPAAQSKECHANRVGQLESIADAASWLTSENASANPKLREMQRVPPPTIPLRKSVKKTKVKTTPGEFQLRGRSFYHKQPRPVTIQIDDDKISSNDSFSIGIETMEGVHTPSPPKRPCPPRLPSFKNRTLGLRPTLKKPPTSIPTSSSATTSTNHTDRENEIIQCDLCNLFIYASQFDSHMKNHSVLDGKSAEKKTAELLAKIQICPICSFECVDYQTFEEHCAENHPEEGFPCPVCTRRMSSKSKLKRHMTIHRKLKFECKICGKAYNRKDNLTAHYKTHGSNEVVSLFYCPICNVAFSSRTGRDSHVACAHITEKQVSHDRCDSPAEFDRNSSHEATAEDDPSSSEGIALPSSIKIEGPIGFDFEYEGDDEDGK